MKANIVIDSNPLFFVFLSLIFLLFYANMRFITRISDRAFLFCSLLIFTVLRLPVTLYNQELNVDESQLITQAHTLWYFPVFWEYTDGTTSGPLNSYILFLGRMITGSFDFITARVTCLLLVIITITALYYSLKLLFDQPSARLSTSLILLFYAYIQAPDFVHMSSEALPVALTAVCLWLLARTWKGDHRITGNFALGFLLALIPFAKLQALPIAFFLGCFCLLLCGISKSGKPAIGLVTGVLSCLSLAAFLLWAGNVWHDFLTFYIRANLLYGREFSWQDTVSLLQYWLLSDGDGFLVLTPLTAVLFVISLIKGNRQKMPQLMKWFIASYLLTTVFCIVKPGMYFTHYFLLLIPVIAFILADSFHSLAGAMTGARYRKSGFMWATAVFVMGANLWCFNYLKYNTLNRYPLPAPSEKGPVVEEILKYAVPGDFLAIWGWWTSGYVQAGMIQATAENHPVRGLIGNSLSPLYIERYLKNIARTNPRVFVDPVGSSYNMPFIHRSDYFESVPSVRDYVQEHYTYAGTIEKVRIYVRKDLPVVPPAPRVP